jgi:3-oxoacyl-[acyl-carrier protein] reductase
VILNHPGAANRQTATDATNLAAELAALRPGSVLVEAADVRDPDAVAAMMRSVAGAAGTLDILVNNAGILRERTVAKMTRDEWQSVIDVNLSGVFYCCKHGLEILKDGGAIVNLGSLAAEAGFHGQANYAAAKAGVQALTRVLARESARRSIRVNAVAPGLIDTPMAASIAASARAAIEQQIPLGRLGAPDEVAQAILFLCSPLASYITGHVLAVNGGWRG